MPNTAWIKNKEIKPNLSRNPQPVRKKTLSSLHRAAFKSARGNETEGSKRVWLSVGGFKIERTTIDKCCGAASINMK